MESFGSTPFSLFPKRFYFRLFPYTPGTGFLRAQAAQIQFAALPWGYTPTEIPLRHQAPSCRRNPLSPCWGWCNSQELLRASIMLEQCPEQKQDCSSSTTIPTWAAVFSSLCSRPQRTLCLKMCPEESAHGASASCSSREAQQAGTWALHFYRSTWVSPHYPPPSPNHQLQLSWSSFISHLP